MPANAKPAQSFIPIQEIRDGIVMQKDGSLRAVVMCSSINFSLKSEDDRTAIISQFQDFLNSLDFSVQIFVQSRKLNIKPYLELLQDRYKKQPTELMKIQTREYIEFIRTFTESTNIMAKAFFVVIPFSASLGKGKTDLLSSVGNLLPGKKAQNDTPDKIKLANFEENKIQLHQRLSVVEQGLTRCGLKTARLGTEELIELYYKIFNPGDNEKHINLSEEQRP